MGVNKRRTIYVVFFILGIFLVSLLLRTKGLKQSIPFWIDEFSTAHQATYILSNGLGVFKSINKPPLFFENRNFTEHFLVAWSFRTFGVTEWSARLPSVAIGALVPIAAFFLSKLLFGTIVGIGAALFTVFSTYEITWSRQARGYMLQQLLSLLALYLYIKLSNEKFNLKTLILLALVVVLGLLTHPLFILTPLFLISYSVLSKIKISRAFQCRKRVLVVTLTMLLMFAYTSGYINYLSSTLGRVNNVWYYHSFLWREYGVITTLILYGVVFGLVKKSNSAIYIIGYVCIQLISISFFVGPYTVRYLNPVMPFILILASYSITQITKLIVDSSKLKNKKLCSHILPVLLVLFIIASGDKFTIRPQNFYSVNRDFREIALLEYSRVYDIIISKRSLSEDNTAVIDTWPDRTFWYLGENMKPFYLLQWSESRLINGIATGTSPYFTDAEGVKRSASFPDWGYINSLPDLKLAMKKYPRGFIFIDDSSLPHDVIEYAQKHLKKELYLDHYPLDDNPYSIWPATLYSWGLDK